MLRSLIFRTLLTNSGITALGIGNSILLSRWLGPVGRGEIAAAMLWPTLLVYLSSMGLIASIVYFTALPDSRPQIVFNNAIGLGLISCAITVPIGFLALPWLLKSQSPEVISASRLFLIVVPISLTAQFGLGVLQGRLRMSAFNWLRTIIPAGYLVGTLGLMTMGHLTLRNVLLLHLALNGMVLLGTLASLGKLSIYPAVEIDTALSAQMLKYGSKVQVGNISGLANLSLDQVLLAAWLPPAYLGLYVVAVSSAGLTQMFSQSVQAVITPGIAQKDSGADQGTLLKSVFRPYLLCSLLLTLTLGAILPLLLPMVFGASFRNAIWPAEILLVAAFFVGAKEVLAGGAQALGNPWLGSKAQLWALLVTVLLLYVLLPRLGIVGAAIATATAYGTQLLVVVVGLHRTHAISPGMLFRMKAGDIASILRVFDTLTRRRDALMPDHSKA